MKTIGIYGDIVGYFKLLCTPDIYTVNFGIYIARTSLKEN